MRGSHLAAVLATLAGFGALGAPSAGAVQWATHVGIGGGGNAFGPVVRLFVSETQGYGSGIGCAGIRGVSGVVCEGKARERVALVLGGDVTSEPYIHNHSTFESFFNGWYQT